MTVVYKVDCRLGYSNLVQRIQQETWGVYYVYSLSESELTAWNRWNVDFNSVERCRLPRWIVMA